ncbi:flagellar filament capping protein FliD [Clostridium sp. JS66]|uniref:flagellar filament capping protein FliD n=1 Tax=Clostridium sp. JS66 TaxID=3064705 RepID=UPI00298D6584|nr:flagellar filament capping protein FliD [Clostridium sp. JS66]WPC41076.1 flagellar filament capping protein FliD [Clostridium sp. JS66]
MSNINRITGLSGFDVDGTIQKLMKAENAKVDKVKQDRQIIQWQQDLYREQISNINTFSSTYFDVTKDTYILSPNTFSVSSVTGSDTTGKINATATSAARTGTYNMTVNNVAKGANISGKTVNVEQGGAIGFSIVVDSNNKTFQIDGSTVTLDEGNYSNLSQMAAALNTKMGSVAVGSGKLSDNAVAVVSGDGKNIQFNKKIKIDTTNNTMTLNVDGKSYNAILPNGNYSTSDIAGMINGQLSNLKSSDGSNTPFPSGVVLQSTDGQNITFINKSDNTAHAGSVSMAAVPAVTVTSGGSNTGVTGTKLNFGTNSFGYDKQIITGKNDTFTIGGTTITLAQKDYTSSGTSDADITTDLITQINTQLTAASATVSARAALDGSNAIQLVSTTSAQIGLSGSAASTLGFASGSQLAQSQSDSINNLLSGSADFTINGVEFKYDFSRAADPSDSTTGIIGAKGRSVSSIMSEISTKANVNIGYSELTRNFTIASRNTGADKNFIAKDNSGAFMSTLFGAGTVDTAAATPPAGITTQKAVDGSFTITEPGGAATTVTEALNNFSIDGVTYKIDPSAANGATSTLNVAQNVDGTLNKIKDFVNKYNDLIGKINAKIDEKRQYSYKPLSDDEKKSLKDSGQEDKITELEGKAKEGLLKNDLSLENMASQMRTAFYDTVKDAGINLYDIGLSTSDDTTQRGKIVIDEDKLKQALQTDSDKISKLFTQKSTSQPYYSPVMSNSDRAKRYSEEGIFQRISDIVQDNVRMSRDAQGNKGLLIQKAGVQGDITDTNGLLPKELQEKDDLIKQLNDKLSDKEDQYYKQFSAMEQALEKLNSQSSWLAQQLGGGQ